MMRKIQRRRRVWVYATLTALAVSALGVGTAVAANDDQSSQYGQSRDQAAQDSYGRQQSQQRTQQQYGGQTQRQYGDQGQQQYGGQTRQPQRGRAAGMTEERNQQLERQVANRLRQQGLGDPGQIMVLAIGDQVILLGTVPDQNRKQQAEQIAQQASGAQQIDNRLQVQRQARRQNDSQLRQSIQQQLPQNLSQDIQVQVQGGQVTLQGQVDNWQDMADAISAAFAAGAQQVNSQLSTTGAGAYAQRPYDQEMGRSGRDREDRDRSTAGMYGRTDMRGDRGARSRQRWQRSTQEQQLEQRLTSQLRNQIRGGETITTLVAGNEVFLFGRVQSDQDKEQASDMAQRLTGIERVDNNLIVSEEGWEQQDDATIQNEVRDELWWSPYVDSDDIQISVNNGVVTLSGQVEDFGEMAAAIENAYEGGARAVQNRLQIAGRTAAADRDAEIARGSYPTYGYEPAEEQQIQYRSRQPRGRAQDQQERMGAAGQSRDMQLEQRIANTLRQQGYGAQGEIMILATPDSVILLGTVPSEDQKNGVEQATERVAAGAQIDNRLHVRAQARRVPDTQLQRNIQSRLADELSDSVQVRAQNGTVTLQGQLDSWTQVADAIDAAFASGASQVNSQFSVRGAGAMAQADRERYDQAPGYTPGRQQPRAAQDRSQQRGMGRQERGTPADLRLARQVSDQLRQELPPGQNIQPIQPQSIYVTVRQGTVTLHGYVQDDDQKQQAEQIVRSMRGVRNVTNDLVILSPQQGAAGQAGRQDQRQDQTRTQDQWQGQTRSQDRSQRQGGWQGQDQWQQQQGAGATSGQDRGASAMSAADRRLTQNVQQEIQDQFPDANINVTASQGTVTLRGTVRNNSERQEIEDIVQSIRGVQDVQNNLRVGSYQPQGYVSGVQEDRGDQDQYGQNAGPQGYGGRAGQDQSRGQMGGQQAAGGASDQALSRQIVQRLRQQLPDIQNVDVMRPGTIYVMVVQGTVMLHGFVQDVNLSQQATQIARDIPGVQNVTSTLSVGSGTGYPAFGYVPPESESARQPMRDQPQQDQQMQDQQMQDRQQQEQQPQGSQSGQQPSGSQQRPGQQSPDLEEDQFDEGQPDPDMN